MSQPSRVATPFAYIALIDGMDAPLVAHGSDAPCVALVAITPPPGGAIGGMTPEQISHRNNATNLTRG